MNKKLWMILAVLCAIVIGVLSSKGTVSVAADGEHQHCICGTGTCTAGDHTTHTNVTWTAWTETGRLPNYSDLQAGDNYYYLTNNVSFGSSWAIGKDTGGTPHDDMGGRRLILCLNGKKVVCTGNTRFLTSLAGVVDGSYIWTKNMDVTITDCQTTGTLGLTSAATGLTQGGLFWMSTAGCNLTVYNGTIDASPATAKFNSDGAYIDITGANSRFTMYGGTLKGGTFERKDGSTMYGGNLLHISSNTANIYGGTIYGGTSESRAGAAIYSKGSSTVSVGSGVVIQDGHALRGGNVYVGAGTFVLNGAAVKDGTAVDGGGNIWLQGGSLTVNANSLVENGSVPASGTTWNYGGNVVINGSTTLTVNGGTLKGGNTNYGGNVYIGGSGTLVLNGGTLTDGNANQSGGNIFIDNGGNFRMTGGTITKGTATGGYGGNIITKGPAFTVSGGTISDGTAAKSGGNLYLQNSGSTARTFNITGGTVTGGKAHSGEGGNIYLDSATLNISNAVISDGQALAGGNIRTSGTLNLGASSTDTAVVSGGRAEAFTTSDLEKRGGNLFVAGGTTTINGATLTAGGSTGNGGNVRVNSTLIMESGSIEASTRGDNLFVNISSTFTMNGGTIKNAATTNIDVNGYNGLYGGKVYINGGTVTMESGHSGRNISCGGYLKMTGGTVSNGSQSQSGGISGNINLTNCYGRTAPSGVTDPKLYLSYFEMTGGTVTGGSSAAYGGNISACDGSYFEMTGGTLEAGTSNIGGNLYSESKGTVTISNGIVKNGTATKAGGNIYADGPVAFSGGTISGGQVLGEGWIYGGNAAIRNLTMTGGTISGGQSNYGGNLYIYGDSTISGGTIEDGEALASYGGNIALDSDGATLSIIGSAVVSGGKAKNGGNIRVKGNLVLGTLGATETVTVKDGINQATTSGELRGGNIFVESGTLTMNNGTVSGGKGGSGGNIRIDGGSTIFYMKGGVIESPVSGVNVFINVNAEMQMSGGTVRNAAAENILVNGYNALRNARFYLSGGTISQDADHAKRNVVLGGYMEMSGGTITGGNSGTNLGGNIYMADATREAPSGVSDPEIYLPTLKISGGVIENGTGNSGNLSIGKSATVTISGGLLQNGIMLQSDYSIPCVAVRNGGTLNVTGGTILSSEDPVHTEDNGGHYENAIWIADGGNVTVTGGYVTRIWARTLQKFISGGFFYAGPSGKYLEDGLVEIPGTYTNEENPLDSRTYLYEIAEGFLIEATSRAVVGDFTAVAPVSGAGPVKANAAFTLNAAEAEGYRFIGWYENGTQVGTESTYSGTATASHTLEAVYEYGKEEGFTLTVSGADSYSRFGTKIGDKFRSGSEVTVKYNGSNTFRAWVNESGKLVSRDAEYTFTIVSDTYLTAQIANDSEPIVIFYNASHQILKTKTIGGTNAVQDSDLSTVPTATGKTNGRWVAKGTVIASVAELEAVMGSDTSVDVIATYDPDTAATYDLTVVGVEKGESGLPSEWTAYQAGNQSYTGINKADTVKLSAAEGEKTFLYYADAEGHVLSNSAETHIRYQENTTIYAVYGDTAAAAEPTVTMITARRDGTTVYFEALRDIPDGLTIKEQGILFGMNEGIVYGGSGVYKYTSNGKEAHDVTGLTMKNIPAGTKIYGRGYVIFTNSWGEDGIIYTDEAAVE